ncbi:Alpha/beta hydrolase family protein [Amycolatopsis regifaucium]|nr:Alpha/beta hydrolase family protein [Amycolatopsis regifaucium]
MDGMNDPTRRRAITVAGLAGITGLATTGPASARERRGVPTFVFAAGANGVSGVPNELVLRGYRCVGVDLPGQRPTDAQFRLSYQAPQDLAAFATEPSPLAGVTVADHIAATVETVRRAAAHGPVVLVGASIGGAAISLVANQVPRLIDLLIYDTAFCCSALRTPGEYLGTAEGSTTRVTALLEFMAGDPATIGAYRSNWRIADPVRLAKAKEAFMSDSTDAEFHTFLNSMMPDELPGKSEVDSRGDLRTWGRIPRVYVRHLRDDVVPLALQDRMIREADERTPGNRFRVFDLDSAHVLTSAKLAELLDLYDRLAQPLTRV